VLGDPQEEDEHTMDKVSTCFAYDFEGEWVVVHDFHKPEWAEPPECLTDLQYVWNVVGDGEEHVASFCRWLSDQVCARIATVRSLDEAGRAQLNALIAEGVPMAEAMARVHPVSVGDPEPYRWPVAGEPAFRDLGSGAPPRPASQTRAPRAPVKPLVRRRGQAAPASSFAAPRDRHRQRCAAVQLLLEGLGENPTELMEARLAVGRLGDAAQAFVAAASQNPDIGEAEMREHLSATGADFAAVCAEVDRLLQEMGGDKA